MFQQIGARILRKKKYFLWAGMCFLLYNNNPAEVTTSSIDTTCRYSIPGIGPLYLDHPLDHQTQCNQNTPEHEHRQGLHDAVIKAVPIPESLTGRITLHSFYKKNTNSSSVHKESKKVPLLHGQMTHLDIRTSQCKDQAMSMTRLPKVSIIITIYNTDPSALLRVIDSVVSTVPEPLLEEIIIFDDASDISVEDQSIRLVPHLQRFIKVKIIRADERVGFLIARNRGADQATAPVLVFLDSQTVCTPGWIEPLLERIVMNRRTIVSPTVDIIDQDMYNIMTDLAVGGFNWNLMFTWNGLSQEESLKRKSSSKPLNSPILPGSLFAVDREFFNILGQHDPVVDTVLVDNIELSLKCWLCGGTIEIHPCSHVGQIEYAPEIIDEDEARNIILNVSMRTAEVWLDEYKTYFYDRVGDPGLDLGDFSNQLRIRNQLKCKPFKWYLENIYPNLFVPGMSIAAGEVRNPWSLLCIDSGVNSNNHFLPVRLYPCHGMGGHQYWMMSQSGEIRRDETCLDGGQGDSVVLYPCHGDQGNQEWVMKERKIVHRQTGKCLTVSGNDTPAVPLPDKPEVRFVTLASCKTGKQALKQEWVWFWENMGR